MLAKTARSRDYFGTAGCLACRNDVNHSHQTGQHQSFTDFSCRLHSETQQCDETLSTENPNSRGHLMKLCTVTLISDRLGVKWEWGNGRGVCGEGVEVGVD